MAFITLSGTLLDPTSELAVGDQVRFTHKSTTGETVQSAASLLTIPPTGDYSIDLQYGLVLVEYKDVRKSQFKNLGVATVNQDNPATSIPELLNALVPVSSPELIEFQAILADCVAEADRAEDAAALSEAFAGQLTTLEIIASSQIYAADVKLNASGFDVSGDGGGGSWVQNGVTGQTPSQSPTQLSDNLINDANGNQWALVAGQTLDYSGTQWYPSPFGDSGNGGYLFDSNGWVYVSLINDPSQTYEFETLNAAITSTIQFPSSGKVLTILGAEYDVVLLSSVTPNIDDTFAMTGGQNPALAIVEREQSLLRLGPKSPQDPEGSSGPNIRRSPSTTAEISYFVDITSGSDANDGLSTLTPFKTQIQALNQIPQGIYHKVRIYLKDGDYSSQGNWSLFNYYISARSTAGFKIIGHTPENPWVVDGLTTPSAVLLGNPGATPGVGTGDNWVISNVTGTEEEFVEGVTFQGRVQFYDSLPAVLNCNFLYGRGGDSHCIGGHGSNTQAVNCDFSMCGSVFQAEGRVELYLQNCTGSNITVKVGELSNGAKVAVQNSQSLFDNAAAGINALTPDCQILGNGDQGLIHGERGLSRGNDEDFFVTSGSRSTNSSVIRGATNILFGGEHPTRPGDADVYVGSDINDSGGNFEVIRRSLTNGSVTQLKTFEGLIEIEAGLRASQRNTPSDPTSGKYIMYMDENTGDLIAKINFEGVTKTAIIVDYSAI